MPRGNRLSWLLALYFTAVLVAGCGHSGSSDDNATDMDTDSDGDGFADRMDVDDDNNGLIEIKNLQQLDWMRNDLAGTSLKDNLGNADANGCPVGGCNGYELVADLDFDTDSNGAMDAGDAFFDYDGAGSATGWLPVGAPGTPFSASFDGNGHAISNLYIDRAADDYVGLFGQVDGTGGRVEIRGLQLDGALASVSGHDYVGLLAGFATTDVDISGNGAAGIVAGNDAVGGMVGRAAVDVSFSNNSADGTVSGVAGVGGLVGTVITGVTLDNNTASGSVTGNVAVGGFAGELTTDVTCNSNSADAQVSGGGITGGFVGSVSDDVSVNNNFAAGDVTGVTETGGLAGRARNTVTISNSYATGDVDVTGDFSGGLVGRANTNTADGPVTIQRSFATGSIAGAVDGSYMGGLVGISYNLDVQDSFATGAVSGVNFVGGLVGDANLQTNVGKSFAVNNVTGTSNTGGFVGWSDTATYNSNYVSSSTVPAGAFGNIHTATGTEGSGVLVRATAQMQCPTRAADPACSPNMYFDWDSTYSGGDRIVWNYGSSSQLPGLVIGGVVYRDGDADGALD
ncbi:MAG TPA: hypothetical protein VKB27_19490 [Gammaproteobacteria bacterium]|nr:hypothetical protein [Gammaproteobacteria bacterium]